MHFPKGFGGAVYASTERDQNPNWDHPPTPPLPYTAADLTVIIRGCEFRRNQVRAARVLAWEEIRWGRSMGLTVGVHACAHLLAALDWKLDDGQAVRNVPIWGGGAIYSNANLTVSRSSFYDNQVLSQVSWRSSGIGMKNPRI